MLRRVDLPLERVPPLGPPRRSRRGPPLRSPRRASRPYDRSRRRPARGSTPPNRSAPSRGNSTPRLASSLRKISRSAAFPDPSSSDSQATSDSPARSSASRAAAPFRIAPCVRHLELDPDRASPPTSRPAQESPSVPASRDRSSRASGGCAPRSPPIASPASTRPGAARSAMPRATGTSRTGSSVSETRIVSPSPSSRSEPIPMALLMRPSSASPASVTPTWKG